jgi:putative heme iron utilization protein
MTPVEPDPAADLLASTRWLALASIAADGAPQASYVPFALLPEGLGVVVSGLAAHTRNLLERRTACALIVAEAPGPDGNYARARIAVDVHARPAQPQSETAIRIWSALEQRQGQLTATLRALPDFMAFVLAPLGARLIAGFAAAYDLDAAQTLEAIGLALKMTG